jgi:glutathione synthase
MQEFLKDALSKGDSGLELLKAYVLMERIKPKSHTAVFLRNSLHSEGQAFSEFGMYSVFLSNGAEIITNRFAGHLVRTKYVGVDEGGVATGYSVLDSPALFNS